MSTNPSYWGRGLWTVMYSIAQSLPTEHSKVEKETKEGVRQFFESLKLVLPCEDCRKHYNEMLNINPLPYDNMSRDALKKWIDELKNQVNQRIQVNNPSNPKNLNNLNNPKPQKRVIPQRPQPPTNSQKRNFNLNPRNVRNNRHNKQANAYKKHAASRAAQQQKNNAAQKNTAQQKAPTVNPAKQRNIRRNNLNTTGKKKPCNCRKNKIKVI